MAELRCDPQVLRGATEPLPDRRRHPRHGCQLPVEIRLVTSSFPIQGETTDVSLGGCYIATMFPLPVGTNVDFRIWVGSTRIACKAAIKTSDPGVGNGIEFLDLDELSRSILFQYLNSLQTADSPVNAPTGAIHPHAYFFKHS